MRNLSVADEDDDSDGSDSTERGTTAPSRLPHSVVQPGVYDPARDGPLRFGS